MHSGGMVLSHRPLRHITPIQTSAKGVRQTQFNKDDTEWLGATKLDVLSLRMLSAIAMTRDIVKTEKGIDLDIDALPENDPETYRMIRQGRTLGVFQIESPGQMRLLAVTQPTQYMQLIPQVALFRPGPIQGNMVTPFTRRARGLEKVEYPHISLATVLKDTYGIILYQEQVLEVAHKFAGMSLAEADNFRKLMSKFRDSTEMESMRGRFVEGAIKKFADAEPRHRVSPELANQVFEQVSKFVGYGFSRAHAAAFARIVEQSAYLKAHFPDAYLAGVMEHQPGFYPMQVFVEEAKKFGIAVLGCCLFRSGVQYQLEGANRIRVPLTRVRGIEPDKAAHIVLERGLQPFASLEDAVQRLNLSIDDWENLARSGALSPFGVRREQLWKVRQLAGLISSKDQLRLDYELPISVPPFAAMAPLEIAEWDFNTLSLTTGPHPVAFQRARLAALGAVPIARLPQLLPGRSVIIGGTVDVRMRPPTARGMAFITLRDESGAVQTAIPPAVFNRFERVMRQSALLLRGKLQDAGPGANPHYRCLFVDAIWSFDAVIGGAQGHCGQNPRAGLVVDKSALRPVDVDGAPAPAAPALVARVG
jgi:error-prone DNA polymerase